MTATITFSKRTIKNLSAPSGTSKAAMTCSPSMTCAPAMTCSPAMTC